VKSWICGYLFTDPFLWGYDAWDGCCLIVRIFVVYSSSFSRKKKQKALFRFAENYLGGKLLRFQETNGQCWYRYHVDDMP
jgi:nucleoside-diphosphate-sugar epimerase